MSKKIKDIATKGLRQVLDDFFWLPSLQSEGQYVFRVTEDDISQCFAVSIDRDGDIWFMTGMSSKALRFRTFGGGGLSLRTRNALLILAFAINLSGEERGLDKLEEDLKDLLLAVFWIPELEVGDRYSRLHDDHDGFCVGRIWLEFPSKKLARISTDHSNGKWIEICRNDGPIFAGLQILALAMKLDGEKRPDPHIEEVDDENLGF